jgi:hypothetical protein
VPFTGGRLTESTSAAADADEAGLAFDFLAGDKDLLPSRLSDDAELCIVSRPRTGDGAASAPDSCFRTFSGLTSLVLDQAQCQTQRLNGKHAISRLSFVFVVLHYVRAGEEVVVAGDEMGGREVVGRVGTVLIYARGDIRSGSDPGPRPREVLWARRTRWLIRSGCGLWQDEVRRK